MVVRRSRVLQFGQQLVERGPIPKRERNADFERKIRGGMRGETRRFYRMVPVKQRVALRRPDSRHERRRGRDKPRTEGNTCDAVFDSLYQAPVNVRFKHAHATTPLIRISIAGPASIRAACDTHQTPNHGTRDRKEHLLDQSSESTSPQALCVIAGVFLGVFDFLFKDLLCHSDTRRSAGEPEQRSPAQSLWAKRLRRTFRGVCAAPLQGRLRPGINAERWITEEPRRKLWFSHYPRPD